jgi:hypothetical protein
VPSLLHPTGLAAHQNTCVLHPSFPSSLLSSELPLILSTRHLHQQHQQRPQYSHLSIAIHFHRSKYHIPYNSDSDFFFPWLALKIIAHRTKHLLLSPSHPVVTFRTNTFRPHFAPS